jgi:hypothetical protein
MKTIRTAILATLAGVLAGAITTGTSASADLDLGSIHTECSKRTDTNCIVWLHGHPQAEGPFRVRYIDDGQFCVLQRIHNQNLRCENYWPFKNPVINASSK